MTAQFYRIKQRYWHIRIDSIFARALLISLLLHILALIGLMPHMPIKPLDLNLHTLNVRLVPIPNRKESPPHIPKQSETVSPPQKAEKPVKPVIKKLLSSPNGTDHIAPLQAPLEKPVTEKPLSKEVTPANDMLAYLNAKRQQRQALESPESTPSQEANIQDRLVPEQKRDDVIMRNLQQEGTSGLFQIREIAGASAQFTFRGWQQNGRNSRFEIITVHAAANETIERAIIRKMIAMIREHYSGDFNWQSQRYGRIVVLSARPQDNQALEEFLLQEFFALTNR